MIYFIMAILSVIYALVVIFSIVISYRILKQARKELVEFFIENYDQLDEI